MTVVYFRRYLSHKAKGEDFSQYALKIIFECIEILPTMFKLFSMCNDSLAQSTIESTVQPVKEPTFITENQLAITFNS